MVKKMIGTQVPVGRTGTVDGREADVSGQQSALDARRLVLREKDTHFEPRLVGSTVSSKQQIEANVRVC